MSNKQIITEIVINAPAQKVFEALTTLHNYHLWNPFIIKSSGLVAEGNRIKHTMKMPNGIFKFNPKVVKLAPGESFEWEGHLWIKGLFDGFHYFHITELGSNQVNLIHGELFSGLLSRIILKRIGDETRKGFVAMNNALKIYVESNA